MNTGHRLFPAAMPFCVKAQKMVDRGECRTFAEAVKKLRPAKIYVRPSTQRLPYADN